MLPLPSDAVALPGETAVAAEAVVVDFDIAASDFGGSEGAAATKRAERSVGDGGGNVSPNAVLDREGDEDKGPESWQRG